MTDAQAILADLARVKAIFQLRTIAMVIGAPPPIGQSASTQTRQGANP